MKIENLTPEQQAELDALIKAKADLEELKKSKDDEVLAKLAEQKAAEQLKEIKTKLDEAYKKRDEALQKTAELERVKKEQEIKDLEAAGKHKEAYEARLAEIEAKSKDLEKRNTELARDVAVKDALKGHSFRNDKASEMAYQDVVAQLVQNDKGQWVHRSGVSIASFVETFAKDSANEFLFKAKQNSGAGTGSGSGNGAKPTNQDSLFKMSQADVLKLAAEGKFGNGGQFF